MKHRIIEAALLFAFLAALLYFRGDRGPMKLWSYDGNPDDARALCMANGKQWHARADGTCWPQDAPK